MSRVIPVIGLLGLLLIDCGSEGSTTHQQGKFVVHNCTTEYLRCLSVSDSIGCLESLRDADAAAEAARHSLITFLQEKGQGKTLKAPLVLYSPAPDFSAANERVRTGPYHFELEVNENGAFAVKRLSSSSGSATVDEILDKSAREVIVVPAFKDGAPAKSLVLITFNIN